MAYIKAKRCRIMTTLRFTSGMSGFLVLCFVPGAKILPLWMVCARAHVLDLDMQV